MVVPVRDQHQPLGPGAVELRNGGLLVVEQIGALAAGADLAPAIDHVGLAQAALDLRLSLPQNLPHVTVIEREICPARTVDETRQRLHILDQPDALLFFIGLGGGHRGPHHVLHAAGEPCLETDVDGENGKDRDGDRGQQRHQRKKPGQAQVQPRACRLRPALRDHPHQPRQHQRGDQQHVDHVGQQHEPQAQLRRPLAAAERAKHKKRQHRQNRPEQNQPEGRHVLNAPLSAQPVHARPSRAPCPGGHRFTSY